MPLFHTPRGGNHLINQLRREDPRQHPNRDVIRQSLISRRLDPTRPRHAATITTPADTKETVLGLAAPFDNGGLDSTKFLVHELREFARRTLDDLEHVYHAFGADLVSDQPGARECSDR